MATHDYVIANGTGAAVRSDLNNALAAIVSNNSGSSEPGTTYAYQWWADTNANVLKIRNSSNDGWVTLRELDGTMLIEDGSAASPGLAFADDTNTGIYSGANNQIGFTTDGVERFKIQTAEAVFNDESNDFDFRVESNGNTHMLFVDAGNDRVGIATSSPSAPFHLNAGGVNNALFVDSSDAEVSIGLAASDGAVRLLQSSGGLVFRTNGDANAFGTGDSEAARINSSGVLQVGASSLRTNWNDSSIEPKIFIEGAGDNDSTALCIVANSGTTNSDKRAGLLVLGRTRGTANGSNTVVVQDDALGVIEFKGNDGTSFTTGALIKAQADAAVGTDDMPGRLVFATSADGSGSPTERVRIDSSGRLLLNSGSDVRMELGTNGTTGTNDRNHLRGDGDNMKYNCCADGIHAFEQNGTERMRIDSSGRLLVNTSSSFNDGSTIQLAGSDSHLGLKYTGTTGGNETQIRWFDKRDQANAVVANKMEDDGSGTQAAALVFKTSTSGTLSERIRINRFGGLNVGSNKLGVNTGDGNITVDDGIYISAYDGDYQIRGNSSGSGSATLYIGNAAIQVSSDRRLKENIVDTVVDAAEELKRVRVVDFTWNDPSDMSFNNRNARGTWTGLIAQELIDVFPFAVNAPRTEEDLSIDQDSEKRWLVDQDQLVPVLIKGFQQALARIETLETKVAALEAG
jgi:hypothetical protein